jgi:exodeoxyribonuclease VII small subunit
MTDQKTPGFEDDLAQLEERVRKLEAGDIPLDEALVLFEEGVGLARACHAHLDEAEKRVAALTRGPGGVEERPLREPDLN